MTDADARICAALVRLPDPGPAGGRKLRVAFLGDAGELLREVTVVGELQLLHLTARMNAAGFRVAHGRFRGGTRHVVVFLPPD